MTDDDREAEIRRCRETQTTPLQRTPWGGEYCGWGVGEIDFLLRRLDEARAREIEAQASADFWMRAQAETATERDESIRQHQKTLESYRSLVEENELRAPVGGAQCLGADVMAIAETLLPPTPLGLFKSGRKEAVMIIARALQAYGDTRVKEEK